MSAPVIPGHARAIAPTETSDDTGTWVWCGYGYGYEYGVWLWPCVWCGTGVGIVGAWYGCGVAQVWVVGIVGVWCVVRGVWCVVCVWVVGYSVCVVYVVRGG